MNRTSSWVMAALCAFIPTIAAAPVLAAGETPEPTYVNAPNGITFELRPQAACWADRGGVLCYHRKSGEMVRVRPNGSKPKVTYAPTGIHFPKKRLLGNQYTDVRSGGGVVCIDTRPSAAHIGCMAASNDRWVVLVEKGQFHVVDSNAPIWEFWNYI